MKQLIVLCADVFFAVFAMWLAFLIRLEARALPSGEQWYAYGLASVLFIPFFIRFGLYRAIFRYSGTSSFTSVCKAVGLYGVVLFAILNVLQFSGVPRSVGVLQPIIFLIVCFSMRVGGAHILMLQGGRTSSRRNVLIYGAGSAGISAAENLQRTQQFQPCGFLDDDPAKQGKRIHGWTIFAPGEAREVVTRLAVDDILIALPSASTERRREIVNSLLDLHVRVKTTPDLASYLDSKGLTESEVDLDVLDLLDREPIKSVIDPELFAGRAVLVTGAGGSIGSELCRQIFRLRPDKLVLFDHSEFSLYKIEAELAAMAAVLGIATRLVPVLGDVRDALRVDNVFSAHKPHLVYHAAAYKHVPLMEANPFEAASNNVFGTRTVARASAAHGALRMVLVSTDKAVRPTNFMGASKRLAEQVIQTLATEPGQKTVFAMVRFGNVLGSSGSVVPLFRRQIAAGGPVSVTHPDVVRYFMTIPEAVGLVIEASQMANGGEVFVLDMGQPVKIYDLARKMIRLSGFTVKTETEPRGEIEIRFIGLRPGEKLYEELLIGNDPKPTASRHIFMAFEGFAPKAELDLMLARLEVAVDTENMAELSALLPRISNAQGD